MQQWYSQCAVTAGCHSQVYTLRRCYYTAPRDTVFFPKNQSEKSVMITVFDPLFKPSSTKMSTDKFSTEIPKQVKTIVNSMGILEATEYEIGKFVDGSRTGVTLDTINAIDAALYNPKAKIIVPILFQSASELTSQTTGAYTDANVAYLVINPKSNTTQFTSNSSPNYSVTTSSGSIVGTGATDQANFAVLAVPGGVTSASDSTRVTESVEANGIQVAGLRLVNYRFYRSGDDDYPITFDNVEQLFYGYKTTTTGEGASAVTTVNEVIITSNSFSLSLVQQILCIGCDNGQTFPILPTDDTYTVTAKSIKGIGSTAQFNPSDGSSISYTVNNANVGLSVAFLEGSAEPAGNDDKIKACHIYGKIYIATK